MIARTMILAAALAAGPPSSAPAAPPHWGEPVEGLRCRVTPASDTLQEGDRLKLAVDMKYEPSAPDAAARFLNREQQLERYTVHLRNTVPGREHARQISFWGPPIFGNCDGTYSFEPLERPLPSDSLTVPLFKPEPNNAGPGRYEVWVTYENDGRSGFRPDPADEYGDVFWKGTLVSNRVPLRVGERPPEEVILYTNAGICADWSITTSSSAPGQNGPSPPPSRQLMFSWDPTDSVAIRYVPRPGHHVGRVFEVWSRGEGGEKKRLMRGRGGAIMERSVSSRFGAGPVDSAAGETLEITVTIYEAAVWHRFGLDTTDPDLYRVLFSRTLHVVSGITPSCSGRQSTHPWSPPTPRRVD